MFYTLYQRVKNVFQTFKGAYLPWQRARFVTYAAFSPIQGENSCHAQLSHIFRTEFKLVMSNGTCSYIILFVYFMAHLRKIKKVLTSVKALPWVHLCSVQL